MNEKSDQPGATLSLRLDKWLWWARFCRSRTTATKLIASGRVRCHGAIVAKAHHGVRPGDVLAFPQGEQLRVVRVLGLGSRRGPATEARSLYEDLAPPERKQRSLSPFERDSGAGRPTKRERRALDRLRDSPPGDDIF